MTAKSGLPAAVIFSVLCLPHACLVPKAGAAETQFVPVSQATLSACQNFANRLKTRAIEGIKITQGPFDSGFGQSIPNGCSFKVSSKPDSEQAALQRTISADWKQMSRYQADGPGGMSYAIQNATTVCFVSQDWDDPGDDATPEEMKKWKPKPDSVTINCTDKQVLEQIDNRKE